MKQTNEVAKTQRRWITKAAVFTGTAMALVIAGRGSVGDVSLMTQTAEASVRARQVPIKQRCHEAARIYDIDANLICAIGQVESSGDPQARNGTTLGVMQLTMSARRSMHLSEAEALDPSVAVEAGAYWFRKKLEEERGDVVAALESYRCGPACVGTVEPRKYVRKIINVWGKLKERQAWNR